MRVGVDATCWQNSRGYGRHARALLGALVRADRANQYTLFVDSEENIDSVPPEAELRMVPNALATASAASSNGHRSLKDMWRMSRALADRSLDVLLFPTVYSFVPVITKAKKVVMIHDIIAERFPDLTLPRRGPRLFWKAKVALGRWQASALVTVSEHSKQGIVEYFGVDPSHVHVVGEASDPIFRVLENQCLNARLQSLGLDGRSRYVVYVGGFGPHKNLKLLVEAFVRIANDERFADIKLVLVGEYKKEVFHSYYGTIRRLVDERNISDRVVFTGFLADEELVPLLNSATVLTLPSLLEGFGLPAVEAAACGLPVVATTASPLPKLLAGGGIFVDPCDPVGWERALRDILSNEALRAQLRDAGLRAARRLTWEAAARQMMDVLQRVAS